MDKDIDDLKQEKVEQLQEQTAVEVFTTPTCPYCTKLKRWLDEHGIDYTEHNVAEDQEQAMRMVRTTGQQGVPQTFVGDEAVIGFQPQKIQELVER